MVVASLELGLFFFFGFGCLFFVVVIELSLDGCIGVEKAGGPS